MKKNFKYIYLTGLCLIVIQSFAQQGATPFVPSLDELNRPFGKADVKAFQSPPQVFHPETWFHYVGGNVAAGGITADLEALADAGFSGIQLFHGQFGVANGAGMIEARAEIHYAELSRLGDVRRTMD